MKDDQLPPEGRLTEEQRARMRAELMASTTAADDSGRSRPWLVPLAAASAVGVLLAGATVAGLALTGDHGGDSSPPAAQGSDSPTVGTSSTPSITPTPSDTAVPGLAPPEPSVCEGEAGGYLERAPRLDEIAYDGATTYLFGNETMWVVCDDWAARDGGAPTLLGVMRWDVPLSKELFRISQNYSMTDGSGQYVAAGARPPGVSAIAYTFPTGDTVAATFSHQMWSMVYRLPDPPRRAWTDPVRVDVTLADGSHREYELSGMDLCAQVNHGC